MYSQIDSCVILCFLSIYDAMTVFHRLLAENIKKRRLYLGASRDRLAEKAGISTNYLSEIESGKKFPRPELLERLCLALEMTPCQMFQDQHVDDALLLSELQRICRLGEELPALLRLAGDRLASRMNNPS
jgi:transcriptional regulator with XRE-family HTH domain